MQSTCLSLYMHAYSLASHILSMCMYVSSPRVREISAERRYRKALLFPRRIASANLSPISNLPGVHTRITNSTERIESVRRDGPEAIGGGRRCAPPRVPVCSELPRGETGLSH